MDQQLVDAMCAHYVVGIGLVYLIYVLKKHKDFTEIKNHEIKRIVDVFFMSITLSMALVIVGPVTADLFLQLKDRKSTVIPSEQNVWGVSWLFITLKDKDGQLYRAYLDPITIPIHQPVRFTYYRYSGTVTKIEIMQATSSEKTSN